MTAQQVKYVGKKVASGEPVTAIHRNTNIDGGVVAAIVFEAARAYIVLAPAVAGAYFVIWVVLAIRAHV